jgi:hypothetical protein
MVAYATEASAIATTALVALLLVFSTGAAVAISAAVTPIVFAVVASRYFRPRGAREPLPTALWFAMAAAAPLAIEYGYAVVRGLLIFWLPVALAFLATWAVGAIRSTMPWPELVMRPAAAPDVQKP